MIDTMDPIIQKPEWLVYRAQTGSLQPVYTEYALSLHKNTLSEQAVCAPQPQSKSIRQWILSGCAGLCGSFGAIIALSGICNPISQKNRKLWGKRKYPRDFSILPHFEAIEINFINLLNCPFWD
jgi:hypothetical protein